MKREIGRVTGSDQTEMCRDSNNESLKKSLSKSVKIKRFYGGTDGKHDSTFLVQEIVYLQIIKP